MPNSARIALCVGVMLIRHLQQTGRPGRAPRRCSRHFALGRLAGDQPAVPIPKYSSANAARVRPIPGLLQVRQALRRLGDRPFAGGV